MYKLFGKLVDRKDIFIPLFTESIYTCADAALLAGYQYFMYNKRIYALFGVGIHNTGQYL